MACIIALVLQRSTLVQRVEGEYPYADPKFLRVRERFSDVREVEVLKFWFTRDVCLAYVHEGLPVFLGKRRIEERKLFEPWLVLRKDVGKLAWGG